MSQYRRGDITGHWSNRIPQTQDNDRIPPIAYVGALIFVLLWLGLFTAGAAAGF